MWNKVKAFLETGPHLQCSPAKFIASIRMHSTFLQDPLHLARIPFGCCRRQSFTGIHLTKDHYSLAFCLFSGRLSTVTSKTKA